MVKNGELQLQKSNKTENPRIWTPILDPQYGPQNMDPQYGPQIWTLIWAPNLDPQYGPPIIWDDDFIGNAWGNHESFSRPISFRTRLKITTVLTRVYKALSICTQPDRKNGINLIPRRYCAMSSEQDSFAKGDFSTFATGFLLHKLLLKVNYSPLRVKKSRSHDMGHWDQHDAKLIVLDIFFPVRKAQNCNVLLIAGKACNKLPA
jgi:hypothetical protein